ncbi:formate transporter [Pseudoclavibacter endophyticus]|uniref:Formate/nitrite transporter family protein n=1 Tax=Pseudoclavibacter endophyticus TaxID=1778590 RepID=A0A6H9WS92_9MICO|nr:formate/nitrite transporter family protein [Pseudoclavibacter endophyticus]KAB1649797.1 formate/nitrite transporter family protein [Pseudoclavibacter endophyticus]GGA59674.1 formate transporter [Pseudoclavibacter endophyticus]
MSYIKPADLATAMVDSGAAKIHMATRDMLIRGFMGGSMLAIGAVFAVTITTQTGEPLLGALLFPVGFVLLYLLGYDLLTGVFTLAPLARLAKRPGVTWGGVLRCWGLIFAGNLAGAVLIAFFVSVYVTYGFTTEPSAIGQAIAEIGHGRTVGYAEHGTGGMATLFIRAVLCNWMVSTGVVAAMMSTTVQGKVVGMWLPIMLFFYLGFEHSIVNLFLFPAGLMLGADFTLVDYLLWNELPTVLGNLVGGILFVGLAIFWTHGRTAPARFPNARAIAAARRRVHARRAAAPAPTRRPVPVHEPAVARGPAAEPAIAEG